MTTKPLDRGKMQYALEAAATNGWVDALRAIVERAKIHTVILQVNWALYEAARENQLETMRESKKQGATQFGRALEIAAGENHLEAMHLLKAWGARNFGQALTSAAGRGQLEAMRLLKHWGAYPFEPALARAAAHCRVEAMRELENWGARDYGRAAKVATEEAQKLLGIWRNE
jgi:hypothetical protein